MSFGEFLGIFKFGLYFGKIGYGLMVIEVGCGIGVRYYFGEFFEEVVMNEVVEIVKEFFYYEVWGEYVKGVFFEYN